MAALRVRRKRAALGISLFRQLVFFYQGEYYVRSVCAEAAPERVVAAGCLCAAQLVAAAASLQVVRALREICECVLHLIQPAPAWKTLPTAGWSSIFDLGFAVFSLFGRLCLRAI